MSTLPPCAGRWDIFDSTNVDDHARAALLCEACPIITECRQRLEAARLDSLTGQRAGIKYGPQGTWAGMPVGVTLSHVKQARRRAEDRMFTADEVRAGHNAYQAGDRTERVRIAERVYQRNRPRGKAKAA